MTHEPEHGQHHWYLVSYDIRDPRRWRQAYKRLRGTGEWLQYSLFRCHLDRTDLEILRWELEKILAAEDDLLIVRLCSSCAARVQVRGQETGWDREPPRFEIL